MSRPLYPREKNYPVTHWIEGWLGHKLVWTTWRKFFALQRLEFRPLGCPARSQSLYRMRHPGEVYNWDSEYSRLHMDFWLSPYNYTKTM
jgi:hypothetical protein